MNSYNEFGQLTITPEDEMAYSPDRATGVLVSDLLREDGPERTRWSTYPMLTTSDEPKRGSSAPSVPPKRPSATKAHTTDTG